MSIKLGNNASAHLAAPLANDGTTIVLAIAEITGFPALGAGEYFPLTLSDSSGNMEIVKVTAISSNILTAQRAQEGTSAKAFDTGSRAEIRVTAGVFDAIKQETQANLTAGLASTQSAIMASTASNLAVALSALIPTGFGPVPWSGPDEPAGWLLCDGRTLLAASPYTALRAYYIAKSFPHGQDGSGNPKIPDMRGRTVAGVDAAAGRLTGGTLGATLGSQTHTLATTEMPSHSHTASTAAAGSHAHGGVTDSEPDHAHTASSATAGSHTHTTSAWSNSGGGISVSSTGGGIVAQSAITSSSHAGHSHSVTVNAAGNHTHSITSDTAAAHTHGVTVDAAGSGGAHNNVQPTLVANFIVKT